VLDLVFDLVLYRVYAVAHVASPSVGRIYVRGGAVYHARGWALR
jgi:hypothetical protein